jgi:2-dehydro-3-deoxygluconokinase
MEAAKRHGLIVSYDLNYRPSLWKGIGGAEKAREVNRKLVSLVDVLFGNEEDFSVALGYEVEGVDEHLGALPREAFTKMIDTVVQDYPQLQVIATTLRVAKTATRNDWAAISWDGGTFYDSAARADLEIFDRVGGGDSFASGLIYGYLADKGAQWAVDCGAAHGALAMTTPGDTSMATLPEVERVMKGGTARVSR